MEYIVSTVPAGYQNSLNDVETQSKNASEEPLVIPLW